MAGGALQTLEKAVGRGGVGSGFEGLQPTSGLGTGVHALALQSRSSHQGGPEFAERGFLNFLFLESSVPERADAGGAVG